MALTLSSTDTAVLNTVVANLAGTATADANLLIQETTTVAGIDAVFEAILSDANSVKLLNAFKVISNDANSVNAAVKVDYTSDVAKASAFRAALKGAWDDAADTGDHNVAPLGLEDDIEKYFIELVRGSIDAKLENDGFSDLLQAGKLNSIGVSFSSGQVEAAAQEMETNIGLGASEAARMSLVKQVDELDMEYYYGGFPDAADAYFLPIKAGKSLTFVFNTTVTEPSVVTLVAPYVGGVSAAGGGGYSGALLNQTGANAGSHTKKIALICHLGSRDAYFARDISGATLPTASLSGTDAEKLIQATKAVHALPVGLVDCASWGIVAAPTALAPSSADLAIYTYARAKLVSDMATQWLAGTVLSTLTGDALTAAATGTVPAADNRKKSRPNIA